MTHYPDILENIAPQAAIIREEECIGCTKCIQACPVDAIIGAAKQMHTVIGDECIGCGLCLPPCPVDCIDLVAIPALSVQKTQLKTEHAKARFNARTLRLIKNKSSKKSVIPRTAEENHTKKTPAISADEIKAAMARVMAKRKRR
jgi:electron transport complex protein RnfB